MAEIIDFLFYLILLQVLSKVLLGLGDYSSAFWDSLFFRRTRGDVDKLGTDNRRAVHRGHRVGSDLGRVVFENFNRYLNPIVLGQFDFFHKTDPGVENFHLGAGFKVVALVKVGVVGDFLLKPVLTSSDEYQDTECKTHGNHNEESHHFFSKLNLKSVFGPLFIHFFLCLPLVVDLKDIRH